MEKKKSKTIAEGMVEVLPLKDFVLFQNDVHIVLKKGETNAVPERFLQNLKTEKVIKE